MPALDWSQCPAVESVPEKRSGAWVFKGTRIPVSTIFENLEDMSVDAVIEEFGVTREQVEAVLDFVARSTEAPVTRSYWYCSTTARLAPLPVMPAYGDRGSCPRMGTTGQR